MRERQARSAHVDSQDDFGLLLRYGVDCIGAVGIRPSASAPLQTIAEVGPTPGRTVSGVQKKLLVVRNSDGFAPAGPTGPAPFIAKFNSEAIDSLVRNELRSLRWTAAVLGKKEVTDFEQGRVGNDTALIITRFDRGPNGEKFRQEDCAQILVKPRNNDHSGKYDSSYEEVAEIIRTHSSRPTIDLARYFRRLVAFALIGNCDAHLKNFSLLETSTGLRLSPAYDVLNTAFYDNFDKTFGLAIGGKFQHIEELDGGLFRRFGKAIGLNDRVTEQTFSELKRRVERATPVLRPPPGEEPSGFATRFAEIVGNQCLRILAG